jgi:cobaltochelatase CobS
MTPEQVEMILGPRGSLIVSGANRPTVRKWLVAQGFPAAFTVGLSMRELAVAYNETDGTGLAGIRRKLESGQDEIDDAAPAAPLPFAPATAISPPYQGEAPANDPAALLRQILLQGYTPGLDESRVRSLVQESIAGIAPRVIEIRAPGHEPIRLPGITHPEFERCLRYLTTIGPNGYQTNILLTGPAGCGKTYLISQLAKALDVDHTIIGGSAGVTEGDIIGRLLPGDNGAFDYVPSEFVSLYERGRALIGIDEIDAMDNNMVMCANMPLSNSSMYVHLRRGAPEVKRGERVYFIATANTYGTGANPVYCGRNPMDGATLDRFMIITVDYDHALEESIGVAGGLTSAEMAGIWELRDRCREAQLRRIIGTRAFQKAAVCKMNGESWREIRDRLLQGWSKDEKAKVGV